MKIGITGATGFLGGRLARLARENGHRVVAFSRNPRPDADFDETRKFSIDEVPDLSGLDAIVHLAGEPIMGWWTPPKKRRILRSRVEGTRRIAEALNRSSGPPVFVCGSAVGYYGDTGDRIADEASPAGVGFLAEVTAAWEAAAREAAGARVVLIRTGLVLGHGGAMRLIGPVFRAGVGGRLGSGRQWMSCIHADDVAGLILHTIENPAARGPVNAVMPEPVQNREFTRILGGVVRRPALLPAPSLALKIALGELSHVLLDSSRVVPQRAKELGYRFRHANLAEALGSALSRASR